MLRCEGLLRKGHLAEAKRSLTECVAVQESYTFPLLSLTAPTLTIITTTKPTLGPGPGAGIGSGAGAGASTLYGGVGKTTASSQINAAATHPTHPDVATSLITMAELSLRLAEYDTANALLQRAIRCLRGHVQVAHHPLLIRAFFLLGQVLHEGQVGDLTRAEANAWTRRF